MEKVDVKAVRRALSRAIGSKVIVRANKGRRRFDVREGVISEVYPHIFMIELDKNDTSKTVSYTYTDVLTKDVQLRLCTE